MLALSFRRFILVFAVSAAAVGRGQVLAVVHLRSSGQDEARRLTISHASHAVVSLGRDQLGQETLMRPFRPRGLALKD